MTAGSRRDLDAFLLDITPGSAGDTSQHEVFQALCKVHVETISWYLAEKRRKAFAAKFLRGVSIVFLTAGSMIPLFAPIYQSVSPYWGYILLGVAAAAQLVDRHFGFTKAWSRCVASAMEVNSNLLKMQARWWVPQDPPKESQSDLLTLYADNLGAIISSETAGWVDEMAKVAQDLEGQLGRRIHGESHR
ncbi:SLATT domain-containing protein [Amycolatopsis sp. NPDC004169]|uniref:SLATT domain-containing protein n=1 Tax=Amycolatopsis sp. NPDC004169 TaxID=3154453 RepID=UPI0033B68C86